jgi:tricorn protease
MMPIAFPSSLALAAFVTSGTVDLPRLPALSPDGSQLTFTWRGDLWKVPVQGGAATRLTSHPADDAESAWLPDGSGIVFTSDREGGPNLWFMQPDGSGLRQVTTLDVPSMRLTGIGDSPAGRAAYFDAFLEGDLYRSPRSYLVPLTGGEPRRVHDAFGTNARPYADGSIVVFERGGSEWSRRHYRGPDSRDVWTFNRAAEPAKAYTRLTEWAGNDGHAFWTAPATIVFLSDRKDDTVNLFRRTPTGAIEQLTSFKGEDIKDLAVSADGSKAAFTVWDRLYSLDLSGGGQPRLVAVTATEDAGDLFEQKSVATLASEAALSPDGKVMAVIAFGDVWVKGTDSKVPARRVTDWPSREKDIAWSADSQTLYFTSDHAGTEDLWQATVTKTRDDVKKSFEAATKPIEQPKAAEATAPATDPAKPAEPAPATDPAKPAEPAPATDPAKSAEPAPATDPAKAAEPVKADAPKQDGAAGDKKDDKKDEKKPEDKKDEPNRWPDAVAFEVTALLQDPAQDRQIVPSPDGTRVLFRRNQGDLCMLDLATKAVTVVQPGWDSGIEYVWSPDSTAICFAQSDMDFNSDLWIVPGDLSKPAVNITRHPDNDGRPRFSADGKVLVFLSERTNEELDAWYVFLDRSLESLPKHELEQYFKDAGEAAKKRKPLTAKAKEKPADPKADASKPGVVAAEPAQPADPAKPAEPAEPAPVVASDETKKPDEPKKDEPKKATMPAWDLDDAYLRVRRITSAPGNEGNLEVLPAGDRILVSSGEGLQTMKLDGTDTKKLTGSGNVLGLNFAGDAAVAVSAGKAATIALAGGEVKSTDLDGTIRVDRRELNSQKFLEAARAIGEGFYHPTMKGLDWDALTKRYHALACQSRTGAEFDHVANRFLGELNASHLGIRSPRERAGTSAPPQGRLGLRVEPGAKGFVVKGVLPEMPAAKAKVPLLVGDVITAVEFEPVDLTRTLESHLPGLAGREAALTVERTLSDGRTVTFDSFIVPAMSGSASAQSYENEWRRMEKAVHERSGGRLGYIHIKGMDQPSLDDFERGLYAAGYGREGLIVDVRNNGGGWTADRLMASLATPTHAYTIPRGGDGKVTTGYPQDRLFIQRCILPTNMLCNEKSFSNAEITAHAFKAIKRGTLVGQQTYGGVISTGGITLLDGTTCRMPFRGWYLLDGTDMENNGAMPDLVVPQLPQDEAAGVDAQLDAAVDDIMKRLPKR